MALFLQQPSPHQSWNPGDQQVVALSIQVPLGARWTIRALWEGGTNTRLALKGAPPHTLRCRVVLNHFSSLSMAPGSVRTPMVVGWPAVFDCQLMAVVSVAGSESPGFSVFFLIKECSKSARGAVIVHGQPNVRKLQQVISLRRCPCGTMI